MPFVDHRVTAVQRDVLLLDESATRGLCPGIGDGGGEGVKQGLTPVHYSAQLEPFLTQKHTLNTPITPYPPFNIPETTPNCTHCHTEDPEVEPKSGRV
jgi:hypothetical protein